MMTEVKGIAKVHRQKPKAKSQKPKAKSQKPKANLQFFDDLNFDEPIFG